MFRKANLLVILLLVILAACNQALVPEAEIPPEVPVSEIALPPGVRAPWDDTPPDPDELTTMFGGTKYDNARGVAKHSSGVYVVGETYSNLHGTHQGNGDGYIRKYDVNGGLLWGRQFGSSNSEQVMGVASDAGDNAYVVGRTAGNLAGAYGGYDGFIRKYTPSGGVVWTRQFGTKGSDSANSVAADLYGNVYVVGYSDSRYFLRKYSMGGTLIWTYHASTGQSWRDVAVDVSGNIYVAGNGSAGMLLRKFGPNGGAAWTQEVPYYYQGYGIAVAVSGTHIYLVGNFTDQNSGVMAVANKFNADGARQWSRAYNVAPYYVYDASADGNGDLYFTGYYYQSSRGWAGLTTKASSSFGQDLWQTSTSGGYNFAVVARSTQDVYVAGYTYGNVGAGNQGSADAFVKRLNGSNGATVWTR